MDKLFFSVIIPALNEEEFLPRLLMDLSRQKDKDLEVIIVDGGSTDQTLKGAEKFSKKFPLIILKSDRANVCRQRNLGAENAQGKYLVFFDADVQIPPQFLHRVKSFLQKKPYPYLTTDVTADSHNIYDGAIVRLLNITMDLAVLLERPFVGGYNFIILRTVFLQLGGFREDIVHAEDMDLSNRLHDAGYRLALLKNPKLKFSLRRYRQQGRLTTLRKNAQATLHILTRGPITREIFSYPMGGLFYKLKKPDEIQPDMLKKAEQKIKRFVKLLVEQ